MELLEELRERLKDCENFEVFKHEGEVYARNTRPSYKFFKVIDLEGLSRSLPAVTEPGRVLRLTKESLKCLQQIQSNTRS